MLLLPFGHPYYKLEKDVFTTIRGKHYFKALTIGTKVFTRIQGKKINLKVIGLSLSKISEIPFDVLKTDGEFPGYIINTVDDFIRLINSFRGPDKPQVEAKTRVTLITLQKI